MAGIVLHPLVVRETIARGKFCLTKISDNVRQRGRRFERVEKGNYLEGELIVACAAALDEVTPLRGIEFFWRETYFVVHTRRYPYVDALQSKSDPVIRSWDM